MASWLKIGSALAVVATLAPAIAWLAFRCGKSLRGGLALGAILLGIGEPLDPPPKEKVESAEPGRQTPTPGAPPPEDGP